MQTQMNTGPSRTQERVRYQVLEYVYQRAGNCTRAVDLRDVRAGLQLSRLQLLEAIAALVGRGYLRRAAAAPHQVFLTHDGLRYIRWGAGLRQSVRG